MWYWVITSQKEINACNLHINKVNYLNKISYLDNKSLTIDNINNSLNDPNSDQIKN